MVNSAAKHTHTHTPAGKKIPADTYPIEQPMAEIQTALLTLTFSFFSLTQDGTVTTKV